MKTIFSIVMLLCLMCIISCSSPSALFLQNIDSPERNIFGGTSLDPHHRYSFIIEKNRIHLWTHQPGEPHPEEQHVNGDATKVIPKIIKVISTVDMITKPLSPLRWGADKDSISIHDSKIVCFRVDGHHCLYYPRNKEQLASIQELHQALLDVYEDNKDQVIIEPEYTGNKLVEEFAHKYPLKKVY